MNEPVRINGPIPIENGFLTAWENPRPDAMIESLDSIELKRRHCLQLRHHSGDMTE